MAAATRPINPTVAALTHTAARLLAHSLLRLSRRPSQLRIHQLLRLQARPPPLPDRRLSPPLPLGRSPLLNSPRGQHLFHPLLAVVESLSRSHPLVLHPLTPASLASVTSPPSLALVDRRALSAASQAISPLPSSLHQLRRAASFRRQQRPRPPTAPRQPVEPPNSGNRRSELRPRHCPMPPRFAVDVVGDPFR